MDATVLLVKALGGGWDTSSLPKFQQGSAQDRRGVFKADAELNPAKV